MVSTGKLKKQDMATSAAKSPTKSAKAAKKPAAKAAKKPATKAAKRPATKAAKKPAARTTKKPAAKAAKKPSAKAVKKPAAKKPAAKKPATKAGKKTATPKPKKATSAGSKPAAAVTDRLQPGEVLWDGASPATAGCTIILAHGASGNARNPGMALLASEFVAASGGRARVGRFDFPKGFAPGPITDSFKTAIAAARAAAPNKPVFLAGRSMGGRYATYIGDEIHAGGIACFGYPFNPMGGGPPRVDHFPALKTPTIILQGERDSFGGTKEVDGPGVISAALKKSANVRLVWIPDGDHGLTPRASTKRTARDNVQMACEAAWKLFSTKL
jgi:predicted alpha/beta-hydrolase family hydrolase